MIAAQIRAKPLFGGHCKGCREITKTSAQTPTVGSNPQPQGWQKRKRIPFSGVRVNGPAALHTTTLFMRPSGLSGGVFVDPAVVPSLLCSRALRFQAHPKAFSVNWRAVQLGGPLKRTLAPSSLASFLLRCLLRFASLFASLVASLCAAALLRFPFR